MPSRSNVVCVDCEKEMLPHRTGAIVEEHTDDGGPYKIWSADVYRCSSCGQEVIARFARDPIAHHHEREKYDRLKEQVEYHVR